MNRVKRCFYVNFSFRLFSKKNRPDGVGRKKEKEETTDWSSAKRSAIRQPRNRPINRWLSDPINIRTHHSIERRSSRQKWRGPIKIFDTGIDILRRPEKNSAPKNSRCCCCFFWFTWKFQKKKTIEERRRIRSKPVPDRHPGQPIKGNKTNNNGRRYNEPPFCLRVTTFTHTHTERQIKKQIKRTTGQWKGNNKKKTTTKNNETKLG